MSTVPDDILKRIQKLMRLADPSRGATQAECENAMRKAKELMTQHGLESVNLDEEHRPQFNIQKDEVRTGRKEYTEDRYIGRVLQQCFGIRVLWSAYWENGLKRHSYILVGDEVDRVMARTAIPIIKDAMTHGLARYLKAHGLSWRAQHAHGFFEGVAAGYVQASEQGQAFAFRQANKANADKYALVLVEKSTAIDAFIEETMVIRKGRNTTHTAGSASAFFAGASVGKSLDLTGGNKLK